MGTQTVGTPQVAVTGTRCARCGAQITGGPSVVSAGCGTVEHDRAGEPTDVVVYDFDGTLFDVSTFLPPVALRAEPAAWDGYAAAAEQAPPITWVHQALRRDAADGHPVVVLTARDESQRAVTQRMITAYDLPVTELVMHPGSEWLPDAEIKSALLDDVVARYGPVAWVYDDRPSVIRMWRQRGLHVVVVPTWPTGLED